MKYTPENCEKLARQLIDLMPLEDIKELAVYSLSQEMQKREDIFDMNLKLCYKINGDFRRRMEGINTPP